LDQPTGGGEAKARAFKGPFGREERFEAAFASRFVHPHPGIGDRNMYVVAARHVQRVRLVTINLVGRHRNTELSSVGHGVACVQGEVEHHLFELIGVNPHISDIFRERPNDGDVRSHDSFENFANLRYGRLGVEDDWFGRLGAPDGLELFRQ
jgi:hypothetical protein